MWGGSGGGGRQRRWRESDALGESIGSGGRQRQSRKPVVEGRHIITSVCHQFLTLVQVLRKSGFCGKSTVFKYKIGFLGMLRNRLRRCSLFLI